MTTSRSTSTKPRTTAKTAARPSSAKAAGRAPKAPVSTPSAQPKRARVPVEPKQPKVTPAAKAPKPKPKLVRDSFTMPQADFALVALLKERALDFKRPTKKSELLRAGLHALAALDNAALRSALEALAPLKPGRPKKGE
jgi:hypothetical protein